jgi:hypothetical protein
MNLGSLNMYIESSGTRSRLIVMIQRAFMNSCSLQPFLTRSWLKSPPISSRPHFMTSRMVTLLMRQVWTSRWLGVRGMILKASCVVSRLMPPEMVCHWGTPEAGTTMSWPTSAVLTPVKNLESSSEDRHDTLTAGSAP